MATVEQTMMKVQRILTGPLGLQITLQRDLFTVRFAEMSTAAQLRIQEWGKDSEGDPQSLVLISSMILRGVKPSPELFEWVGRHGGSRWIGHVEVLEDKEPGLVVLMMSHTLLGDYLDERELEVGLKAVLFAADEWDDELQKRFGGKRWIDP